MHPPRPANCTFFCLEVLFLFRSLITNPRTLLCKRRMWGFSSSATCQICQQYWCFHRQICNKFRQRILPAPQKRPVNMHHSLIDPAKLYVFGGSRRHQKMRKNVIYGCLNLWGTSMSFLPVTCDAARGLQCPKETSKRCTENRCTSFKPTRTHVDRTWSIFRTFCCFKAISLLIRVRKIRILKIEKLAVELYDFLRFFAIFCEFSPKIKLDTGKRL